MNKTLDLINVADDYLPIIRASEMEIGKKYLIIEHDIKKTQFGKRSCLSVEPEEVMEGEEIERRLLFLGPSFADGKKLGYLKTLLGDTRKKTYISLARIIIDKDVSKPIYTFTQQ